MRKRTVKLWRLHEDGRKLFAGTIEAADPRELVLKWSAFLATAERGTYFATYRGSFVGPEPALANSDALPPSRRVIRKQLSACFEKSIPLRVDIDIALSPAGIGARSRARRALTFPITKYCRCPT